MSKEPGNLIPTNIITGFSGAGKTTAIRHLLAQKPVDEHWAVLVTKFDEVGEDSNSFAKKNTDLNGITLTQVPGGCICWANGLPLQVALNLMLAELKPPHRLLIEPTGLGHPKEVLAVLSGKFFSEILRLEATLTLVDSRKLKDKRCIDNTTFNEQLEIAELIVANKSDLYESEDFPALLNYIDEKFRLDSKLIYQVRNGAVKPEWLTHQSSAKSSEGSSNLACIFVPAAEAPTDGYVRKDSHGDGCYGRGWIFSSNWRFDATKLLGLVQVADVERMKGVFRTTMGCIGFNKVDGVISQTSYSELSDSRIELISRKLSMLKEIEEFLLSCVVGDRQPSCSNAQLPKTKSEGC